jgi:hypothetical protein
MMFLKVNLPAVLTPVSAGPPPRRARKTAAQCGLWSSGPDHYGSTLSHFEAAQAYAASRREAAAPCGSRINREV